MSKCALADEKYRFLNLINRKKDCLRFLLPVIGLSLWWGYQQLQRYLVEPEAAVVLGGHEDRERFAAKLAAKDPDISIWVSSGSPQRYVERIFTKAGIQRDRLHLNYHAVDTVTNFTTLVDDLKARGIDSVYLITSENHMRRALIIGEIVFGSQGIVIKPLSVPSEAPPEPIEKSLRDGVRAILWLTTGDTGEEMLEQHHDRSQL
ncbi:MAG: YdcF family protein [Hydrococcus sp. CSU_1_8]|nr:YdcF family protein [Hydrococcus sp. CSU_1_8]